MAHKLRLLVKIDTNPSTAELAVTGCLTEENSRTLLPIIRRLHALVGGTGVTVNLSTAKHIEPSALGILEQAASNESLGGPDGESVRISLPAVLPFCPAMTWNISGQGNLR